MTGEDPVVPGDWAALDVTATWLPQAATASPAAPAAAQNSMRRRTRPARVPDVPMVYSTPAPALIPCSGCQVAMRGPPGLDWSACPGH
ncbi:MAG TPA: hypothetical protein VMV92_14535 [Streptosporangiaceae bacterium]|nr:hypothetical protein [Streptosporangiaceae bacterium]